MRTDWARLRAVVLESDDWGLCAWSADDEAWRALAATPAFRSAPGRAYGRSTLESAADVQALLRDPAGVPRRRRRAPRLAGEHHRGRARLRAHRARGLVARRAAAAGAAAAARALGAAGAVRAGGRRDRRRRLVAGAARAHARCPSRPGSAPWPAATPTRAWPSPTSAWCARRWRRAASTTARSRARRARAASSAPARSSRGASAARRSRSARPTTAGTRRSRPTRRGWACGSCRASPGTAAAGPA